MKNIFKWFHRSEKGFTLIELLVVIAVLGILAAVAIPNVSKFIGRGAKESANSEVSSVVLAVTSYMADNNAATIAASTVGPTADGTGVGDAIEAFLTNPSTLQADYTISTEGKITAATKITGSKWGSLTFTNGSWA
jgi:type IV pilus assembly protein PilA